MSEEYIRDLQMQADVDKVLEDIKAEIYDLAQWYMEHDMEDIAQVICLDVIAIIDKHIGGGKNDRL